uniref:Polar amino acid ABC transporter, inner membrane subunit n=1 Tax=Shewanella putrefaciens (strain 200) TaxID=399804 RepID=E6XPY8_SHEP2
MFELIIIGLVVIIATLIFYPKKLSSQHNKLGLYSGLILLFIGVLISYLFQ